MKTILTAPLQEKDLRALRAGDVFYYTGLLATSRDAGHARVVREGQTPSFDFSGQALFHAGPIMQPVPGGYEVVSIGPTTSMRMDSLQPQFMEKTGVRLIIGKGGMGSQTAEACARLGAVQAVIPGGCAVVEAELVEEVCGVEWLDLGMPEALWICRVREFGPLTVLIDTVGGNLFEENRQRFAQRRAAAMDEIRGQLPKIK